MGERVTRQFPLSAVKVAAGCAIAEGKALVIADHHILVITAHPISRIAPNADGDGWPLDDEDDETQNGNPDSQIGK